MDEKSKQLTNKMLELCNQLNECIVNAKFSDDEELDDMDYIIDRLKVTRDAMAKHYYTENYQPRNPAQKLSDGSYKQIYVYHTDDCFNGFWEEGTPELIKEIDLGQGRDWSYDDPKKWE